MKYLIIFLTALSSFCFAGVDTPDPVIFEYEKYNIGLKIIDIYNHTKKCSFVINIKSSINPYNKVNLYLQCYDSDGYVVDKKILIGEIPSNFEGILKGWISIEILPEQRVNVIELHVYSDEINNINQEQCYLKKILSWVSDKL